MKEWRARTFAALKYVYEKTDEVFREIRPQERNWSSKLVDPVPDEHTEKTLADDIDREICEIRGRLGRLMERL